MKVIVIINGKEGSDVKPTEYLKKKKTLEPSIFEGGNKKYEKLSET